jgi:hypothetical protein
VPAPLVVCEEDVREAIESGRKIVVGPGSIVTPLARDLGTEHSVLVWQS